MTARPRYYIQTQHRSPTNPMSSVSYYCVIERATDEQGRPYVTTADRFSVGDLGDAEAKRRAGALLADLKAKECAA